MKTLLQNRPGNRLLGQLPKAADLKGARGARSPSGSASGAGGSFEARGADAGRAPRAAGKADSRRRTKHLDVCPP